MLGLEMGQLVQSNSGRQLFLLRHAESLELYWRLWKSREAELQGSQAGDTLFDLE